jgi:hypothetical protein
MGRPSVSGLSALPAGLLTFALTLTNNIAAAEHAPVEASSLLVRAWGQAGSVERVRSSDGSSKATLADDIDGGTIPRWRLHAELNRGIGRFLQNVRVHAVLSHGHFLGWKLLALFPARPEVKPRGLQNGDVILRVNGSPIERPEAFKAIWDALRSADEVTVEIDRAGQPSKVHYKIIG